MPVDPQCQALLALTDDQLGSLSGSDLDAAREGFSSLTLPLEDREPVHSSEDLTLEVNPGHEVPVRVTRPSAESGLGVLVWFHGGGWVVGDLDSHDQMVRQLTNRSGCVVVSVDYRRAPESPFPAAFEDCLAVTSYVVESGADSLDVDPARVAVGGDSAGGNLAGAVALAAAADGMELAFQLLAYPVCAPDFDTSSYQENAEGYLLTRDDMIWFWDRYVASPAERLDPRVNLLVAGAFDGVAPVWIATGEFDPLRDEGNAFAALLANNGVEVHHECVAGMIHGFMSMGDLVDRGDQALSDAAAALAAAIG